LGHSDGASRCNILNSPVIDPPLGERSILFEQPLKQEDLRLRAVKEEK
jgi:hypothetical protein